jgi:hypothetical protein
MRKFVLTILKANGSVYWTEGFDTRNELDKWLEVEKTKFYWKRNFTVQIQDNKAEVEAAEKAAREEFKLAKQKKVQLRQALADLKKKPAKTIEDLNQAVESLIEFLDID